MSKQLDKIKQLMLKHSRQYFLHYHIFIYYFTIYYLPKLSIFTCFSLMSLSE